MCYFINSTKRKTTKIYNKFNINTKNKTRPKQRENKTNKNTKVNPTIRVDFLVLLTQKMKTNLKPIKQIYKYIN